MTDADESMACFSPILSASPNSCASLPMFFTASSPRSSPSATFIWSAACTKSSICCLLCMPRRPASPARSLSCSRAVRVSIFIKSSLSCCTASSVSPVYFFTPLMCSAMSAYSFTYSAMACLRALNLPAMLSNTTATPCHLLPIFVKKLSLLAAFCSSFIFWSSLLASCSERVSACHCSEPRSTLPLFSSLFISFMVALSSFGVAESSERSTFSTVWARDESLVACVSRLLISLA